ncbi:methyl-accepting chemotaxis protein [Cytobacillus sp.]|uniref:methyl-accepting chemotaxis protein n=1 Tax=Cytobacillus sp. TaxID=2675269 RepID=UPI0028BE51DF|nr:methyl-accepting chemotaxis protein [Cytobacillus sp.]
MLKSIKGKLILLISVLFIAVLSTVGFFVYQQTDHEIEKEVVSQTKSIVAEMNNSLQLFLGKYSTNMQYLSESGRVIDYIKVAGDEKVNIELEKDFTNFLDKNKDVASIYAASANKDLNIMPKADLGADFDPTSRDWYTKAAANPNQVVWSEPYEDAATKEYVVTASYAVKEGSKVIGVIGLDIKLTDVTNMISSVHIGYNGYPFVFSQEGTAIVHPTERSNNLMDLPFIKEMYDHSEGDGVIEYVFEGADKKLVFDTVSDTNWKVGAAYSDKELMVTALKIRNRIVLISMIGIVIAIAITYFVAVGLTRPLALLKKAFNQVSSGNLTVKVNVTSKDEIGELSGHFNTMVENMKSILTAVNLSVNNVKESAESLSAVSEETNASSEEMAAAINEIAKGATQSAADAESANQLSNQLSNQINDISEKATEMTSLAEKAEDINQSGIKQIGHLKGSFTTSREYLGSMEEVITDLENKIVKIEKVMTTITEISSQTNLLALNASIEAARAGEHGKGFAVVAEEVRKLAEQSVVATDEVKLTITDIQNGAFQAVESMNKTKETFNQQSEVVSETEQSFQNISELVERMRNSILYISNEMTHLAESKEEVVSGIHSMAAMAEQAAASCEEVSASTDEQLHALQSVAESAEQLTELSNELKDVVEKFKIN